MRLARVQTVRHWLANAQWPMAEKYARERSVAMLEEVYQGLLVFRLRTGYIYWELFRDTIRW
jgi:hypothetical protein